MEDLVVTVIIRQSVIKREVSGDIKLILKTFGSAKVLENYMLIVTEKRNK